MNRRFSLRPFPFLATLALPLSLPFFAVEAQAQEAQAQAANNSPVEGEFLVRWAGQKAPLVLAPTTSPARWQQQSLRTLVNAKVPGTDVARTFAGSGWSLIKVPAVADSAATRARLVASLGAANVSFNFRRHINKVPNDPEYGAQWHLPKIKAPEAWNLKTGDARVVVAVLDTGVDLTHPDLKPNLWVNTKEIAGNGKDDDKNGYIDDVNGLNAINPAAKPQDDETDGHGTHCAGLLGAVGNNGNKATGVAWNVKIMALKFLDAKGDGDDADAIECLEYAVKMKNSGVNLRVISNSWSGLDDNPALKAAFQLAEKAGILNICAAGNDGYDNDTKPAYPASYTLNSIVSVAASDQNDALPSFSNYGKKSVDLAAPGNLILSLGRNGKPSHEMSGTSMATPIVAGAAALLLAKEPGLAVADLKKRLLATVDPVASLKGKVLSGGRLNLFRTLSNATLNISGLVYRLSGTTKVPLAGAIIRLKGVNKTSTPSGGKYLLGDIAPGTYTVTAILKGYTFPTTTLVLPSASGVKGAPNGIADLAAQTVPKVLYTISGRAMNAQGKPEPKVNVFIGGIPEVVAVTSTDGKYVIKDRAAGTYQLNASSSGVIWTATPASVTVPAKTGTTGAPNGIVNFSASVPDSAAPAIVITAPKSGATLSPATVNATGTANDASGSKELYFQLTRITSTNFDFAFYDWTNKVWTTDANAPGIKATQAVSGTVVNWTRALPATVAGSYTLRVWGKDILGNESDGTADAETSFDINSSAGTSTKATRAIPTPSGNDS
jgi:subtilisin family serine protease